MGPKVYVTPARYQTVSGIHECATGLTVNYLQKIEVNTNTLWGTKARTGNNGKVELLLPPCLPRPPDAWKTQEYVARRVIKSDENENPHAPKLAAGIRPIDTPNGSNHE